MDFRRTEAGDAGEKTARAQPLTILNVRTGRKPAGKPVSPEEPCGLARDKAAPRSRGAGALKFVARQQGRGAFNALKRALFREAGRRVPAARHHDAPTVPRSAT